MINNLFNYYMKFSMKRLYYTLHMKQLEVRELSISHYHNPSKEKKERIKQMYHRIKLIENVIIKREKQNEN